MPNYRRCYVRGGTYFFTVTLANRRSDLLTKQFHSLKKSIEKTKQIHPITINAWVVLPEHIHTIWTLPEDGCDFSKRWRSIKTRFCIALRKSNIEMQTRNIWQRGYWEHVIRDDTDFSTHFNYVHINPVKHGYVKRVSDRPYSSFHHYVRKGVYSNAWGKGLAFSENMDFGE